MRTRCKNIEPDLAAIRPKEITEGGVPDRSEHKGEGFRLRTSFFHWGAIARIDKRSRSVGAVDDDGATPADLEAPMGEGKPEVGWYAVSGADRGDR
jgi:hypothetical protein